LRTINSAIARPPVSAAVAATAAALRNFRREMGCGMDFIVIRNQSNEKKDRLEGIDRTGEDRREDGVLNIGKNSVEMEFDQRDRASLD
jgi:hypothetical protein